MPKIYVTQLGTGSIKQPGRKVKAKQKVQYAVNRALAHPKMPKFMQTKEGRKIFAIGFAAGAAGGAAAGGTAVHTYHKRKKR